LKTEWKRGSTQNQYLILLRHDLLFCHHARAKTWFLRWGFEKVEKNWPIQICHFILPSLLRLLLCLTTKGKTSPSFYYFSPSFMYVFVFVFVVFWFILVILSGVDQAPSFL
jgi:hypothetical protein